MSARPVYDTIGIDYAKLRRPDRRIAAMISQALGTARTVLNVGAGTGSYEPSDKDVTAIEPSAEMIKQRPPSRARVVHGSAEDLPFADNSFDAAMAVLTVHHWSDQARGLREVRRVSSGPIVILTYDPAFRDFWLLDYFPQLVALDERQMPPLHSFADSLGPTSVSAVPIPHDCIDGFLAAYWRRPAAILDPRLRAGSSAFRMIGDLEPGLARLRNDLESGVWAARYGDLLARQDCDCGYRLVVTA